MRLLVLTLTLVVLLNIVVPLAYAQTIVTPMSGSSIIANQAFSWTQCQNQNCTFQFALGSMPAIADLCWADMGNLLIITIGVTRPASCPTLKLPDGTTVYSTLFVIQPNGTYQSIKGVYKISITSPPPPLPNPTPTPVGSPCNSFAKGMFVLHLADGTCLPLSIVKPDSTVAPLEGIEVAWWSYYPDGILPAGVKRTVCTLQ